MCWCGCCVPSWPVRPPGGRRRPTLVQGSWSSCWSGGLAWHEHYISRSVGGGGVAGCHVTEGCAFACLWQGGADDGVESCMVAVEMTLGLQLSSHGYPKQFAEMVVHPSLPLPPIPPIFHDPLPPQVRASLLDAAEPAFPAGRVLLLLTELSCGPLLGWSGGVKPKSPSPCRGDLLGLVLECVEARLGTVGPPSLLSTHPHLLSSLAILLNLDPCTSDPSHWYVEPKHYIHT